MLAEIQAMVDETTGAARQRLRPSAMVACPSRGWPRQGTRIGTGMMPSHQAKDAEFCKRLTGFPKNKYFSRPSAQAAPGEQSRRNERWLGLPREVQPGLPAWGQALSAATSRPANATRPGGRA
jgi:hypothetical protein